MKNLNIILIKTAEEESQSKEKTNRIKQQHPSPECLNSERKALTPCGNPTQTPKMTPLWSINELNILLVGV